ncbi:MAG: hypothetical protein ALECFALPRED_008012 [Alectoria fallacina]|uniref:F-box domain-containing protein n=1 Tax=Alectoria fallacina TaxID=1903189 RepID=A0A8H3IDS6_9LECA|nr:MAG: hypothetical protein ALECFALPRED_008012 [Alectoria fallacina]
MVKRSQEDQQVDDRSAKRLRPSHPDRLSHLSDELLLRTLSCLSVSDLVLCQRLSCRFNSLAGDSQLWKALFYDRFVRPRASRIPGVRDQEQSTKSLYYSSKISKWLDDDHLVRRGSATNWKRKYKLRHNWSRGSANVSETQLAEHPSQPPLLVRLHDDIVVTADPVAGLRAWMLKGDDRLIASTPFHTDNEARSAGPTSLAVDETLSPTDRVNISVGYEDGSFAIYTLQQGERRFARRYVHAPSRNGAIHAIAYASPYLLTMTGAPLLSLYRFVHEPDEVSSNLESSSDRVNNMDSASSQEIKTYEESSRRHVHEDIVDYCVNDGGVGDDAKIRPPTLISSLRSQTAYPPTSLAIRASSTSIVASIAYAMPTWTSGWSVGLQEIRLTPEGAILDSRVASAAARGALSLPLDAQLRNPVQNLSAVALDQQVVAGVKMALGSKLTSLSYNHPYLLSAHPDNTLTLYMVTSNTEELSIGVGSRLWGHTSSVSGAHVGDRGKAVSVSAIGNELRVWELEGGMSSSTSRKRAAAGEASVQVRPEKNTATSETKIENTLRAHISAVAGAGSMRMRAFDDSTVTQGWVAFDEEKVVLLREKMQGAQALVVYDFA